MRKLLIIVAVLVIVSCFFYMTDIGHEFIETIYAVALMLFDIFGYIGHDHTTEYILAV